MKIDDIVKKFREKGIPDEWYWLGPVDGAEMQNGLAFNGHWLVYYREKGMLLNQEEYETEEEAVSALEKRLVAFKNYCDNKNAKKKY